MLSKVERGERNPTLGVALEIAAGLGVGLSELMSAPAARRAVHRMPRRRRRVFVDPESGFERHLLSPVAARRTVEFVMHVLPRGRASGPLPPYPPGVTKIAVVEAGTLAVTIGGRQHTLEEGDALFFEADVEHEFSNAGGTRLRYYLVVSYPR